MNPYVSTVVAIQKCGTDQRPKGLASGRLRTASGLPETNPLPAGSPCLPRAAGLTSYGSHFLALSEATDHGTPFTGRRERSGSSG